MVYNLVVSLDEIASAIGHAFRWLIGYFSTLVYNLIIVMYDLFEYLARAEIINNSFVQEIYRKVGFLLCLFMVFKLVFSLIQSLIDPNKLNDPKNGYAKILTRCVISIVLLGITPTIFKEAYQLQNLLIGSNDNSDNVLYKLIIGSSDTGSDSFGRVISTEAYFAFYRDDEFPFLSYSVDTTSNTNNFQLSDSKIEEIKLKIRSGERNFDYAQQYLNYNYNGVYTVEFNELLSIVFGIGILWMLVLYCIQVAVRVFQLAYLQIIAPVPILSYISDPEGSFSKWLKQCTSTFLDLFIRLAIIYFVIYFANYITLLFEDNNGILAGSTGLDPNNKWMWALLEIFLILGLLVFAKKVPDLIKDLFPSLGGAGKFSFGLKAPKEVKNAVGFAAGGVAGAAVGLIGGHGVVGRLQGVAGGLTKGAVSGAKGKKISEITSARAAQNRKNREIANSESTLGGRVDARLRNAFGLESRTAALDRQIHDIDMNDIRAIDDQIHDIDVNDIKPIDDEIYSINNNPIMETKRRNDAVIGANKTMRDEAEKELLKAGLRKTAVEQAASDRIRGLKADIDWARENIGQDVGGYVVTDADIRDREDAYKKALEEESAKWIDRHTGDNAVVISNMRKISNETGTTVNTAAGATDASDRAKTNNNANAAAIEDLEFRKQELERQKSEHEDRKRTLNDRKSVYEEQKQNINRQKERPQADENAINKR